MIDSISPAAAPMEERVISNMRMLGSEIFDWSVTEIEAAKRLITGLVRIFPTATEYQLLQFARSTISLIASRDDAVSAVESALAALEGKQS